MNRGVNLMVSLGALGALAAVGLCFGACSSSSSPGHNNPMDSGTGGEGGPVPTCTATPGGFPAPNCDNSAMMCGSSNPCAISDPKCGSTTTCEPFTTNMGNTLDFRMRSIDVAAPPSLAQAFIQSNVVTPAVDLNAMQCGETGKGTFNWLISVDKAGNMIKSGGAPPTTDPFGVGYCFVNHMADTGQLIAPVTGPITFSGNTFTTTAFSGVLNVPIFLSGDPTMLLDMSGNLTNLVILPIRNGVLKDVTISPDSNCIGSLNVNAFTNAACMSDPSTCSKWNTAGTIGGYITLADADNVNVSLLNESLCVLLTGTTKDPMTNKCQASALTKGDYCSTTQMPGGCNDSSWLAATFAASAVVINSGTMDPICQPGGGPVDAGGG